MTGGADKGPGNLADDAAEERAARIYFAMNLLRIAGIAVLCAGIAMTREILPGPYWLGVGLAVAGVATFFFAPTLLLRRWNAADRDGK